MNADRKLISQPSVDSENNERVSTDRVGSFPFHAYNQYPTIYVCTHNGPTLHAHCVTIVLIAFFTSISFFPLLFIYFIFHIDHFSIFIYSFIYFFLIFDIDYSRQTWNRVGFSCTRFVSAIPWKMQRMERNFFYFYSFWWKIILRCEVQF